MPLKSLLRLSNWSARSLVGVATLIRWRRCCGYIRCRTKAVLCEFTHVRAFGGLSITSWRGRSCVG